MKPLRKAVITAAGKGTRQYPATHSVKKELFPLVDRDGLAKPVLQIIAEEALESGIEEICIVASPRNKEQIESHFKGLSAEMRESFRGKEWALKASDRLEDMGRRMTFVLQHTQEGYGHAVHCARDFVGDDPFLLMLGDHIYLSGNRLRCARQLISVYERFGGNVSAVQRTPESLIHLFGTLTGPMIAERPPVYRIASLYEKPDPAYASQHLRAEGLQEKEYLCFFGMHILGPAIFDILEDHIARDLREGGEIQLTSAQTDLLGREPYLAMEPEGSRYDMGVPAGYVETQMALALHSPYRERIMSLVSGLAAGSV
ncbi:MAG: NTP transferase domain-containing protein [Armatimonadetes bacterium]|nr:NTP transferase domain-containing protein [Armatimonadota bacterium]